MTDIEEKVYEIVCEHMGASRDKLAKETSFINDLGADSLDTVELVMEFESAFVTLVCLKVHRYTGD